MIDKLLKDPFFLLFFSLPCAFIPVQFIVRCYTPVVAMYYLVASAVVDVTIWFACSLLGKRGNAFKAVIVYLASFLGCVNLYVWCKFEFIISPDVLDVIFATNMDEVGEFFSTFVSPMWLFFIGLFPLIWVWGYRNVNSIKVVLPRWTLGLFFLPYLLCIILSIHAPLLMSKCFGCELWWSSLDENVDLSLHQTNPSIIELRKDHPKKFVLILGESFARSHSSLYGYEYLTNPRLGELYENGDLLVFSNVNSPATSTQASIKQILIYNEIADSDSRWYDIPNFIEMSQVAGYHTSWNSNQSYMPMFDDVSTAFAHICEEEHFNDEKGEGLDDFILNFDYSSTIGNEIVIYHLMGQHGMYSKRFSADYALFTSKDYMDLPEHQRQTIADYDNATLYNDYVVASAMEMYANSDAIIFYFPDHGQDLYETDPDLFGHGRLGNPASVKVGEMIPFFIYTSCQFRELHPEAYETLCKTKDIPFCTSHFCKLAFEIMGYQLKKE